MFRYNWSAPLILSPHDSQDAATSAATICSAAPIAATSWAIISPDLSTNDPELTNREQRRPDGRRGGAETHATIITVVESPTVPGLIWAGTDDGNVQVTRDGGKTWTNVRAEHPATACPSGTWVSRVEASHFERGTAYVSFDGHRSDNFKPYIFKTHGLRQDVDEHRARTFPRTSRSTSSRKT